MLLSSTLYATCFASLFAAADPLLVLQAKADNVWVTIDPSGSVKTITPSLTTSDGTIKTISAAPSVLTQTTVYTLTTKPGDAAAAYTTQGIAPIATAIGGRSGAGAFVACSNYQGRDAPFCLPRRGSMVAPGSTYYVTWDSTYFANHSTLVQFNAWTDDDLLDFSTHMNITAGTGFYVWTVDANVLTQDGRNGSDLVAYWGLRWLSDLTDQLNDEVARPSLFDNTVTTFVTISHTAPSYTTHNEGHHNKTRITAVAVSVSVGAVLLALGMFALLRLKRRDNGSSAGGRLFEKRKKRNSDQSGTQIQLTDRESWAGGSKAAKDGGNVFRKEVLRQERVRGY